MPPFTDVGLDPEEPLIQGPQWICPSLQPSPLPSAAPSAFLLRAPVHQIGAVF